MRRLPILVLVAAAACGSPAGGPQVTAIDLLKTSDRAEKRPAGGRFEVAERSCGGVPVAGIDVPVPSRVIFRSNFPARARLVTIPSLDGAPGAAAEFRIGISDRRTYETLLTRTISAGTCSPDSTMIVDLSVYAGWQWSLFYRPDQRTWELILGVSVTAGAPSAAAWGAPRVESDSAAVRAFRSGGR